MRRWVLSKKDKKELIKRLKRLYGDRITLNEKDDVLEYFVEDNIEIILCNGTPALIILDEDTIIPHLRLLLKEPQRFKLPKIIVDQGAVKPISRGADLMRPGVVKIEGTFQKGDIVLVCEPLKELPIAVHRALYSYEEVIKMRKGRICECLHHIGDKYWRILG